MSLRISGHKIRITPAIESYVNKKFKRLEHYFENYTDAHLILEHDGRTNKAEVTVRADHRDFFYKAEADDLYAAIDMLIDKCEMQVSKFKKRQKDKHLMASSVRMSEESSSLKSARLRSSDVADIRFEKPMTVNEAILQLEMEQIKFKQFKLISDSRLKPSIIFKSSEGYYHLIQQEEGLIRQLLRPGQLIEYIFIFSHKQARDVKVERFEPVSMSEEDARDEVAKTKEDFLLFMDKATKAVSALYRRRKGGWDLIELDI